MPRRKTARSKTPLLNGVVKTPGLKCRRKDGKSMDAHCLAVDLNSGLAQICAWEKLFRVPVGELEFWRGRLDSWISTIPNPLTGFEDVQVNLFPSRKGPRSFLPASPKYQATPATVFAVQNRSMPGNYWRHGARCGWVELGFATHWPSREYADQRRREICQEFKFAASETWVVALYLQVQA